MEGTGMPNKDYPFTRFTHFGILVNDREKAIAHWEKIGLGPFRRFTFPSEPHFTFAELPPSMGPMPEFKMECAYGHIGSGFGLEVFEPVSDFARSIFDPKKGEHVWHFGYDAAGHQEAIDWMAEQGFAALVSPPYKDGSTEVRFDPSGIGGAFFQMHWMPETSWLMTDFFTYKGYEPRKDTPFQKLTHASAVVEDVNTAVTTFERMGLGPFKRFSLPGSPGFQFKECSDPDAKFECAYGRFHPGQEFGLELLQPVTDAAKKMVEAHKGDHYWSLTYDVENLDTSAAWMAERGIKVAGTTTYLDGTRECHFDTAGIGGLVIQCFEIAEGSFLKSFLAFK
jgi:hypothetical protein